MTKQDDVFFRDSYTDSIFEYAKNGWGVNNLNERLTTGIKDLDDEIDPLLPGDLMIITSDGPFGKTSLALNFIAKGEHPHSVLYFSLEQPSFRVYKKLIDIDAKTDTRYETKNKKVLAKLEKAVDWLDRDDVLVCEEPNPSIDFMRDMICQVGVPAVFVDSLQMFTREKDETIADVVKKLKALAIERHVPIVVLGKTTEEEEQLADVVLKIERIDGGPYVNINITKNRYGYPKKLKFLFCAVISDFSREEEE